MIECFVSYGRNTVRNFNFFKIINTGIPKSTAADGFKAAVVCKNNFFKITRRQRKSTSTYTANILAYLY